MSSLRLLLILGLLAGTAGTRAQPTELVARSSALDRLEFFVGTWTFPDLPPDETYRETCGWVGERRHVVCHSRLERAGQVSEYAFVFTYVSADSTLRFYTFAGHGDPEMMTGRVEGEGFVFQGEAGTRSFPTQRRMTITPTDDGYELVGEQSTGGGPWVVLARFRTVRME